MKKVVVFFLFFCCFSNLYSQDIDIGIRQNQYVKAKAIFNKRIFLNFENSLFLTNISEQFVRGEVGYTHIFRRFKFGVSSFIASNYNSDFYNTGIKVQSILKKGSFLFDFAFQPFYDSGDGYTNCYGLNMGISINENIKIEGVITNIPENRLPEDRFRFGAVFKVNQLWVKPEISIPQSGDINTSRVLTSFGYTFKGIRKHH